MRYLVIAAASFIGLPGCAESQGNSQPPPKSKTNAAADFASQESLAGLPIFLRENKFDCAMFAEAINHFVALGEENTVQAFRTMTASKPQGGQMWDLSEYRMLILCRVLFDPKNGVPLRCWGGGLPMLPEDTMPREKWPQFPVVRSGSSYFLLSESYIIAGLVGPSFSYVEYCRSEGVFRREPVPVPDRVLAQRDLESLRNSEPWKSAKWKRSGQGFEHDLEPARLEYLDAQVKNLRSE